MAFGRNRKTNLTSEERERERGEMEVYIGGDSLPSSFVGKREKNIARPFGYKVKKKRGLHFTPSSSLLFFSFWDLQCQELGDQDRCLLFLMSFLKHLLQLIHNFFIIRK